MLKALGPNAGLGAFVFGTYLTGISDLSFPKAKVASSILAGGATFKHEEATQKRGLQAEELLVRASGCDAAEGSEAEAENTTQ